MTGTGSILDAILAVFLAVAEWISTSVGEMVPMFYAEGSLTFLGVLAVAGLAFSVAFLLLSYMGRAKRNLCEN